MIDASARPARSLKQAISRRLPRRRDDSGLTTLEWLLIVAAVAGLAALAVVLVRNVVTETAESIASNSARIQAAQFEAADVTEKALAISPINTQDLIDAMNTRWGNRCMRMNLSYNAAFDTTDPKKKAMWTDGVQPAGANLNDVFTDTGETAPLCAIVDA
jgi:hypothetical protein